MGKRLKIKLAGFEDLSRLGGVFFIFFYIHTYVHQSERQKEKQKLPNLQSFFSGIYFLHNIA